MLVLHAWHWLHVGVACVALAACRCCMRGIGCMSVFAWECVSCGRMLAACMRYAQAVASQTAEQGTSGAYTSPSQCLASLACAHRHIRQGVPPQNASHPHTFNLNQSKNRVLREFEEKVPPNFRKFFQSEGYDRLLQTFLLYFAAIFQTEWVVQTMEKARRMHLDGYNPYVIAQVWPGCVAGVVRMCVGGVVGMWCVW
eukprot:262130-Chlamydomonas_euryale.AAC.6